VGLVESGLQNVSRIKFTESNGIFIPQKDYYTCEPLANEWLQSLLNRPNKFRKMLYLSKEASLLV